MSQSVALEGLTAAEYDEQWGVLSDFIRYHPGARHRRRLILKMVRDLACPRILDVGCGPGELVTFFRENLPGRELTGCDLSPEVIATNTQRIPDARFRVLDITTGRLDEQFDLVVCSEVIEHVADQPAAFRNLAAMVAAEGHLLITCPTGTIYPTEVHFGHVKHPRLEELIEMGRGNGLRPRISLNWGWPTYRALKFATNINSDWAIENFAAGDYSAASRWLSHLLYALNHLNFNSRLGVSLFVLFERAGEDELRLNRR